MMSEYEISITKQKIRQAGQNLRENKAKAEDFGLISTWRSFHINIMSSMVNIINKKLKESKLNAIIVARRLKRMNSIELKLKRFKDMQLDRMQDIAGVRVVFKDNRQVNSFAKIMQDFYTKPKKRFSYKSTKNYIEIPKDDGYKSIHQIYEYKDKSVFTHQLELQIRTQLQHFWATAVEVLGMRTNTKIKQGSGDENYKEFFKLCSALFSHIEQTTIHKDYLSYSKTQICDKIKNLDKKHNIITSLNALAISSKHIENQANKQNYYFIMELDLQEHQIRITGYKKSDLDKARKYYDFIEEQSRINTNIDVVLISLDNIRLLKKAYPNYYLDCNAFIKEIQKEIS